MVIALPGVDPLSRKSKAEFFNTAFLVWSTFIMVFEKVRESHGIVLRIQGSTQHQKN